MSGDHKARAALVLPYQRVSDGAWFCASCLDYWLLYNQPEPRYRACLDGSSLAGIVCRECVRPVLRESVEDDLVTAYDDPLAWAESDTDWW